MIGAALAENSEETPFTFLLNSGSAATLDLLFLSLLFNTTKSRSTLNSVLFRNLPKTLVFHFRLLRFMLITSTLILMSAADLPKFHMNTLLNKFNSLVMNQYRASATRSSLTSITHVRNLSGLSKEMHPASRNSITPTHLD